MIGSVNAAGNSTYVTASASPRQPETETQTAKTSGAAIEVSLSPGGELLASLPSLTFDPKVHMANAETRLKELMSELGIPPNTDVDIHMSNSGQFTVEGDHKKLAELEKMLNDGSELELRNSLTAAHNASTIQRIAAASQRTQQQVQANPGNTEALWNQMLAEADRIKNQSADFRFSSGTLSGASSDGTAIAIA